MGDSDWTLITDSAEAITDAYARPPRLNECELFYVQIDERDASVTLGFETSVLPSSPPPAWTGRTYNAVEFYLKFMRVKELRITGWDSSARDSVVMLDRRDDESVRVSVDGERSHLDFAASAPLLTRARPFLRSDAS
ncbi:Imm50 family immunity protein [Streptomyces sp. NPDC026092]|uniref:Imm50 family immunity protein n=1 Tax=Streptomyces sp. NPDC026092 TaxID=3154797 RepID=UPI0033C17A23